MTIIANGSNDPQRTRDIAGSVRPLRVARPQAAPGDAPAQPTPSLELSAPGERFVSLRTRLEGLEPSRAARVEQLRQLVAEGRYQPDSEAIAAAMLADPATAAALGVKGTTPDRPGAR